MPLLNILGRFLPEPGTSPPFAFGLHHLAYRRERHVVRSFGEPFRMTFRLQHRILLTGERLLCDLRQTFVHILPDLSAVIVQRMFDVALAVCDETKLLPVRDGIEITDPVFRSIVPPADTPDRCESFIHRLFDNEGPHLLRIIIRAFGNERNVVPYQAVDGILVHQFAVGHGDDTIVGHEIGHQFQRIRVHPVVGRITVMCLEIHRETVVVRNAFEIVLQTVGMTVLGMSEHRPRHAVVQFPVLSVRIPHDGDVAAVEMIVLGDDAVLCLGPRGDVVIQQFKIAAEDRVHRSSQRYVIQRLVIDFGTEQCVHGRISVE
ncbi:hypothetical protein SDC9_109182 [bioreactor metagenome]|uniref:Uncharacterized protein n=1 Tax=bioreactor metagenome TaxID=1076179 RepID=A0A645BB53_9ZZZZ